MAQTIGIGAYGSIFEIPKGTSTPKTLLKFAPNNFPANLVIDSKGNIFGTLPGSIFEIPAGTSTSHTLASLPANTFLGNGALTIDSSGNLFGTYMRSGSIGVTLFKLAHGASAITTLLTFTGNSPGTPIGPLSVDSGGNLFGVAQPGTGTIFELSPVPVV